MNSKDKIIVQSLDRSQSFIGTSINLDTFQTQWERNTSYQTSFTAVDNGKPDFQLLQNENSIWWQNQEYIIKQSQDNLAGTKHEVQVTATHVMYQLNKVRQNDTRAKGTYLLKDMLTWLLQPATDYKFVIHGSFSTAKKFDDFGNCTIQDGLSTLTEQFKIYCIYPDNKTLHIYDQASWVKKTAKRLAYRYNTPTVTFQIDSSSFTNKIRVISTHVNDQIIADQEKAIEKADAVIKAKQDEITKDAATLSKMRKEQTKLRSEMSKITKVPLKKRTATQKAKLSSLQSTYNTNKKQIDAFNSTLIGKRSEQKKRRAEIKKSREKLRTDKKKDRSQPLFEPFDYEDKASIKKWGVAQAEKYLTPNETKDQAINSAKTKLTTEPTMSISLPNLSNDTVVNPGELMTLQVPDKGLLTQVEVVSISKTPFVPNGLTITLNNRRKNYLDLQNANNKQIKQAIAGYKNTQTSTGNQYGVLEVGEINDD